MTIIDRDAVVAGLDEEWAALLALGEQLSDDEWATPTDCPGWTVQDNYSHVIGTEAMLLGRPAPQIDLPHDLPHVRNDLGRANELWVRSLRDRSGPEVLDLLREVVAERRAALAGMDQAAFDAESWTPAGEDTYGRFMRIRVMDQWFHEQDAREATGRPGHLEGLAPSLTLDEVASVMGWVVGKRIGAPVGSSVRFMLTGPIAGRIDIEVSDRARVVYQLADEPTTTLSVAGDRFLRLCGGRQTPEAVMKTTTVTIEGDTALGEKVLLHLPFML